MSQVATEVIRDTSETAGSLFSEVVQAISNLILPTQQELITTLRAATPIKVTNVFVVDGTGSIGGGLTSADPRLLYQCPMSSEGWVHRITVYCPEHPPSSPLTQGEILCTGSTAGEIIFFLPNEFALAAPGGAGLVAPAQPIIEGRTSAPHLNGGERMQVVGDGLPPGIHIRVDIQVTLLTGISEYTPRTTAPGNLDAAKPNIT